MFSSVAGAGLLSLSFIVNLYTTKYVGHLSKIADLNAEFLSKSTIAPLAVFVGGTSGIGEGMVSTFANNTNGNSDIIIVGRNRVAAERIFSSVPTSKGRVRKFVQYDISHMKNVQKATNEILSQHPKINYLVLTTGVMTLSTRDETPEGIDKKVAVHYYSRWKFIHDLLPALQRAKDEGGDAAVISVLAAGIGGPIDEEDLAMKGSFSVRNVALRAPTYNDLMMESFAEQAPKLRFIHSWPGIVRTTLISSSPSWLISGPLAFGMSLLRPLTLSPTESGQYMWHAVCNTTAAKSGAWRTGPHGEDFRKKNYFGNENQRTKLWDHTVEVVKNALEISDP